MMSYPLYEQIDLARCATMITLVLFASGCGTEEPDSLANYTYTRTHVVTDAVRAPILTAVPKASIAPVAEAIEVGVRGGVAPYELTVVSGVADIIDSKSVSTRHPGVVVLRALDTEGNEAFTTIMFYNQIQSAVTPVTQAGDLRLVDGAVYQVSTIGGIAPYRFAWENCDSGMDATIDESSGLIQTGKHGGRCTVKVTDAIGNISVIEELLFD